LLHRFYALCGQYPRALRLFIQCGDREIDAAIEVVGKSQNESLTHQLIDFLVGEKDGVPKDPNYIYRLYLALKKYDDAAKTALIIARQEQDLGNYNLAHSVVVETIRQLEDAGMKVSLQLRQSFVLLHSYMLVKNLVKRGDHDGAARLLLRIAQSVSKFPLHMVQLLTSTVIECQRAGLKASSYEYAAILMRPEYRPSIDANLKRKIEAIVRRRYAQGEEAPEPTSACPVSGQEIPITQLECPTTRDALPMCVVSGRHMVLDDWCFCPVSKCPALYSEYVRYIEDELRAAAAASSTAGDGAAPGPVSPGSRAAAAAGAGAGAGSGAATSSAKLSSLSSSMSVSDPVMGKSVSISDLVMSTPEEAKKYIQRYNNEVEKKETKREEGGASGGAQSPTSGKSNPDGLLGEDAENATGSSSKKSGGVKASKGKIDRVRRHRKKA
jgi:hypothetical protein